MLVDFFFPCPLVFLFLTCEILALLFELLPVRLDRVNKFIDLSYSFDTSLVLRDSRKIASTSAASFSQVRTLIVDGSHYSSDRTKEAASSDDMKIKCDNNNNLRF
jgi:hypothetical protein